MPIPWEADAPSYGFGPTDASWLPQPPIWAEYALDRQRGVAGSTYELYRAALRLRREHGLGGGTLAWVDRPATTCSRSATATLLVLTNFGAEPVPLPAGAEVLHASAALADAGRVPHDVTVWAGPRCRRHAVQPSQASPALIAGTRRRPRRAAPAASSTGRVRSSQIATPSRAAHTTRSSTTAHSGASSPLAAYQKNNAAWAVRPSHPTMRAASVSMPPWPHPTGGSATGPARRGRAAAVHVGDVRGARCARRAST